MTTTVMISTVMTSTEMNTTEMNTTEMTTTSAQVERGQSDDAAPPARALTAMGADIFVIGIQTRPNVLMTRDLVTVADGRTDRVFRVNQFAQLKDKVLKKIKENTCIDLA